MEEHCPVQNANKPGIEELSKKWYHALDSIQAGIWLLDDGAKILHCSRYTSAILGRPVEDIIGKPCFEVVHGASRHIDACPYVRMQKTLRRETLEINLGDRWINMIVDPMLGKEGVLIGAVHIIADITRQKSSEKLQSESEERYCDLFDNMKSGVIVYEAINDGGDFIIRDFNRAASEIENIPREDVLGKSVLDVFPGVNEFGLFEVLRRVWETGVPQQHPISRYKDSRIDGWRENYVYRLSSGEIVAIYDDVTERKKMEEEFRMASITDSLTGLYNRRGFYTLAEQHIRKANRANQKLLLLFIDINHLKLINDTWGHKKGDEAIVNASTILKQTFRESDILARIGGDEYAVFASEAAGTPEILLKRLTKGIKAFNCLKDRPYELSMSIGTAVYDPSMPISLDELMSQADRLMYEQKTRRLKQNFNTRL